MKVAYQLLQQAHRAPAYGLLLPAETQEALHWAIQLESLEPRLFPTQTGWLLTTRKPITQTPAGYVALQELQPGLFIPVDAQLIPGLLSDEAAGLTRLQQVIVLPGPLFHTATLQPVPLRSLLVVPELNESPWQALPEAPPLAEQLRTLEYRPSQKQLSDETDQMLESGNMGKGDPNLDGQLPRPPGKNPLAQLGGAAAMGLGKALGGLGRALGLKGLAGLGANLINKGVNLAPRLVENLLGKQEAALRALLRQFQMGNIDEALRRALPIGGDASRGASIANSASLPFNNLSFNLSKLFMFGGVGASLWLANDDIMLRLSQEYRKQAELAEQRGDHRRAAYIYVKLLNDLNSAAAVLARGGLHRESAMLYLRLNDDMRAADQFEKAGLYDRAIEIYRRLDRYDLSGMLLARLKLENEALAEFTLGADRLVREKGDFLQAGKLLEEFAHRSDLALDYYRLGWQARPLGSPVPCALQMSAILCRQRRSDDVHVLFKEGLEYFRNTTDDQQASTFINGILTDTSQHHRETVPQEMQDQLRDQALQYFGSRLRNDSLIRKSITTLPRLFLSGKNWTASEYSDAEFAYRTAPRLTPADEEPLRHLRQITLPARIAEPTCVTLAEDKGLLFVGFAGGEIFRVNLASGEVMMVSDSLQEQPVALAVSPAGMYLHELRRPTLTQERYRLMLHVASANNYRYVEERVLQSQDVWLSPYLLTLNEVKRVIVYGDGDDLVLHDFPFGAPVKYSRAIRPEELINLAIPVAASGKNTVKLLGFDGFRLYDLVASQGTLEVKTSNTIGWSSRFTERQFPVQPLHCLSLNLQEYLLLAGIGANGMVYLTRRGSQGILSTHVSTGDEEYFATCFVDLQTLVATARNGLHWYHFDRHGLRLAKVQEVALGPTQACYSIDQGQTIVVVKNNTVLYVPRG
ncbi:MAG: hypothetical protein U0796_10335 [Gemmatales bacterium]